MSDQTEPSIPILSRFDFLTMVGAVVTLFIALGAEPWWTLSGTTNSRLLNIQVSPFYLHISATGLPTTVPLASALGTLTRTLLLFGFFSLFIASFRPTAWYRNLAIYFGVSTLAELYLSFVLMFYWAETAFVSAYGITPPYYGTGHVQANILGLDLSYYASPLVTATFNIPYYLGFVSIGFVTGRAVVKLLRERAFQTLASILPGAIHDISLSPPYQRVWFSSGDKQYNPMLTDPEAATDDELIVSFERLYQKVEPGGSLSVIIPSSATGLEIRLERLVPQIGFTVEKTGSIFRVPGKQETELRFRKSVTEPRSTTEQVPTEEATEAEQVQQVPPALLPALPPVAESVAKEPESTPVIETVEEPIWGEPKMTRLEKSILKAAVKIITETKQPVQYRELLNQVYMELVDHKIEFDSARQIEATLLIHNGREVQLIEEADDAGLPVVKKWALGSQKMSPDRRGMPTLEVVKEARTKLPHFSGIFKRHKKSRYHPKSSTDEDTGS